MFRSIGFTILMLLPFCLQDSVASFEQDFETFERVCHDYEPFQSTNWEDDIDDWLKRSKILEKRFKKLTSEKLWPDLQAISGEAIKYFSPVPLETTIFNWMMPWQFIEKYHSDEQIFSIYLDGCGAFAQSVNATYFKIDEQEFIALCPATLKFYFWNDIGKAQVLGLLAHELGHSSIFATDSNIDRLIETLTDLLPLFEESSRENRSRFRRFKDEIYADYFAAKILSKSKTLAKYSTNHFKFVCSQRWNSGRHPNPGYRLRLFLKSEDL